MEPLLQLSTAQLLIFAVVFARIAGLVFSAPLFGGPALSLPQRGLLSLVLAVLMTPMFLAAPVAVPVSVPGFAMVLLSEALVGVALGIGVAILLGGAMVAGRLVAQLGGLSLADLSGLDGENGMPAQAQWLYLLTLGVLVAVGGHRLMVGALMDTFHSVPPGEAALPNQFVSTVATLLTRSFEFGVRAAAPAVLALLIATIGVALLGRTLPQVGTLALGMGVHSALVLLVLAATAGAMAYVFSDQLEATLSTVQHALANVAKTPLAGLP